MSTSRPLHLTDTQLASVRRAAALLRPGERSQLLQAIAYELADISGAAWQRLRLQAFINSGGGRIRL
jgi:hypothetical protein